MPLPEPGSPACLDGPLPDGLCDEIARFLATDAQRPAGLDVYPDVFNSPLLFPLQRPRETAAMMRMARTLNPRVVMEIGADKGGGAYHWVKSLPTVRRMAVCEIRGTPYAKLFESAFPQVDFLWLPASSYAAESVDKVKAWLGNDRFDCVFLDGDKGAFDVDFVLYDPMVRPGGMAMLHDINPGHEETHAPPVDVYRKLTGLYRTTTIIDVTDGLEAQSRAARGEPITSAHEQWLRIWGDTSCGVGVVHL